MGGPQLPSQEEMEKAMHVQSRIATELMAKDPQLPYVSAFIIAGDLMSVDRSMEWLQSGEMTFEQAAPFVGSYGRLAFKLRAFEAGLATIEQVLEDLPDEWSGSDPDDTDPRFRMLWHEAWRRNGSRTVVQPVPKKRFPRSKRLRVYRGQDIVSSEKPVFGIAWSLDPEVARKFARGAATRQSGRWGGVYAAYIPREFVYGFMPNRGEMEVIVDPALLEDVRLVEAPMPATIPDR